MSRESEGFFRSGVGIMWLILIAAILGLGLLVLQGINEIEGPPSGIQCSPLVVTSEVVGNGLVKGLQICWTGDNEDVQLFETLQPAPKPGEA